MDNKDFQIVCKAAYILDKNWKFDDRNDRSCIFYKDGAVKQGNYVDDMDKRFTLFEAYYYQLEQDKEEEQFLKGLNEEFETYKPDPQEECIHNLMEQNKKLLSDVEKLNKEKEALEKENKLYKDMFELYSKIASNQNYTYQPYPYTQPSTTPPQYPWTTSVQNEIETVADKHSKCTCPTFNNNPEVHAQNMQGYMDNFLKEESTVLMGSYYDPRNYRLYVTK